MSSRCSVLPWRRWAGVRERPSGSRASPASASRPWSPRPWRWPVSPAGMSGGARRISSPGGCRGGGGKTAFRWPAGGSGGVAPPGRLIFVAGDALRLPFRDEAFDAVTISFGLRNVASPVAALAEMRRVTRPGGRLVVCEFSAIPVAPVDMLYRRYLLNVLPAIARRTARNPEAYSYLAESITDWPGQRELAGQISSAGWSAVRWRNLSLGVVAVHVGRRR